MSARHICLTLRTFERNARRCSKAAGMLGMRGQCRALRLRIAFVCVLRRWLRHCRHTHAIDGAHTHAAQFRSSCRNMYSFVQADAGLKPSSIEIETAMRHQHTITQIHRPTRIYGVRGSAFGALLTDQYPAMPIYVLKNVLLFAISRIYLYIYFPIVVLFSFVY